MSRGQKELTVELPTRLYNSVNAIAKEREITIGDIVRLYLRTLVTANKTKAALKLDDVLAFGKFQDERLEIVIKAEPKYILWMLENNERFELAPESLELLQEILDK